MSETSPDVDPITVTGGPARGDTARTLAVDALAASAESIRSAHVHVTDEREPPLEILGYRRNRKLGAGGMGLVYEAFHARLKRTVALKLLKPGMAADHDFRERFLRESKAMAAVSHPNVVAIYDAGEHDGWLFMALEYVPGGDVARLLHRRGVLDDREASVIILGCARGLAAIAAAGLVHRDIKPANIFLDRSNQPKIGDLGLARASDGADRMTMTGMSWGTPAYMSPEQIRGVADIDIRADIYALGATLYTILTGVEPYCGATTYVITHKVLTDPLPDPRAHNMLIQPALVAIIHKAMDKDRAARYQAPEELIQDLERAMSGRTLLHAGAAPPAPSPTSPTAFAAAPAGMKPRAAVAAPAGMALPSVNPLAMKLLALVAVAVLLAVVVVSMQGGTRIEHATAAKPASDGPVWASATGTDAHGRWAEFTLGSAGSRFRWIPPGTFRMGSPEDEPGRDPGETPHAVTITRGFYLQSTECTQALWREIMHADPSAFIAERPAAPGGSSSTSTAASTGELPVESVSWNDCRDFLAALARRLPGAAVRLPTEAEWEYACRAGSGQAYAGSDMIAGRGWAAEGALLDAWRKHVGEPGVEQTVAHAYASMVAETNSGDPPPRSHAVASLAPNAWGLYDMHGNVLEWCSDAWDGIQPQFSGQSSEPIVDPEQTAGGMSVCRGGAWYLPAERCRSGARHGLPPGTRNAYTGLRIVICEAEPKATPDR